MFVAICVSTSLPLITELFNKARDLCHALKMRFLVGLLLRPIDKAGICGWLAHIGLS